MFGSIHWVELEHLGEGCCTQLQKPAVSWGFKEESIHWKMKGSLWSSLSRQGFSEEHCNAVLLREGRLLRCLLNTSLNGNFQWLCEMMSDGIRCFSTFPQTCLWPLLLLALNYSVYF